MELFPHLPQVYIDLDAIASNYRALAGRAGSDQGKAPADPGALAFGLPAEWPVLLPVVKADAYGHGHLAVARALRAQGATVFCSGTVQEAALLRDGLTGEGLAGDGLAGEQAGPVIGILSLLGPVRPDDLDVCRHKSIVPLLHGPEQLRLIAGPAGGAPLPAPLPVAVKCNTGMSRLGFNLDELEGLRESLKRLNLRPVLAVSHLHSADEDDGRKQAERQARAFAVFLDALRRDWPSLAASLCNSAGALFAREVAAIVGPHSCRPGLALYGCNPMHGTSLESLGRGFTPAMSVGAPVIARRRLLPGDGIGYGHAFVAEREVEVGIVGVGYSDGYTRSMTNKGWMCVAGQRAPVLGRVAMQMTAVDLGRATGRLPETDPAGAGLPMAWLLGGPYERKVRAEDLAALWGTIPYEIFCLFGRNRRHYGSCDRAIAS